MVQAEYTVKGGHTRSARNCPEFNRERVITRGTGTCEEARPIGVEIRVVQALSSQWHDSFSGF